MPLPRGFVPSSTKHQPFDHACRDCMERSAWIRKNASFRAGMRRAKELNERLQSTGDKWYEAELEDLRRENAQEAEDAWAAYEEKWGARPLFNS